MMCSVFDYTASLAEPDGPVLFDEIQCELAISTDVSSGDFEMTVVSVTFNGVDLLRSNSSALRAVGRDIVEQADQDSDLILRVMTAEGIAYVGLGNGDPEGYCVRRPS